jgi:hypothetical protein
LLMALAAGAGGNLVRLLAARLNTVGIAQTATNTGAKHSSR